MQSVVSLVPDRNDDGVRCEVFGKRRHHTRESVRTRR